MLEPKSGDGAGHEAWKEALFRAVLAAPRQAVTSDRLLELAADVKASGAQARVVKVTPREQCELELPTVCLRRDGTLTLLSERTTGGARVLESNGTTRFLSNAALAEELTGDALDVAPSLPSKAGLLRGLLSVVANEGKLTRQVIGTSLLLLLLALIVPSLTAWTMDRALPHGDTGLLLVLTIALVGTRLHSQWLEWLRGRGVAALEGALESAVLRCLPEHLLRVPFASAMRHGVGGQLEAMDLGVSAAHTMVSAGLLPLLEIPLALTFLACLLGIEPRLAFAVVGLTALSALTTAMAARPLNRIRDARAQAAGEQRSALLELVSGAAGIRATAGESNMFARWLDRFLAERACELQLGRREAWFDAWFEVAHKLARIATFAWCGRRAIEGDISLGSFLACAAYTDGYVSAAHRSMQAAIPMLGAKREATRVDQLLALPRTPPPLGPSASVDEAADAIAFDDVWFRYHEDAPWVLSGFNLRVPRGQVFRLNGASGSGKTTILRLMAGLLTPERGSIRIAGRDPVRMRSAVAYLPQEPYLLSGSILFNMRLLSGASYDQLLAAARRTGLSEQLRDFPMGLETMLPPGGTNLSGGQRQLVLLAAAAASERPIVLFDESLAHLDRLTRATVLEGELFKGKTLVTVEHDHADSEARF